MKAQVLELLALSVELTKSDGDWPAKSRMAVASEIKRLVRELDIGETEALTQDERKNIVKAVKLARDYGALKPFEAVGILDKLNREDEDNE